MLVLSLPALAIDESHVYGVDEFTATGECCGPTSDDRYIAPQSTPGECPDTSLTSAYNLNYCVAQATVVDNVFDDWEFFGHWDESRFNSNAGVDPEDFSDEDMPGTSWGKDHVDLWGADDADVAYISSHGGHSCTSGTNGYHSYQRMGQVHADQDCTPDTFDDGSGEMFFGDADMEIFVADACNSAQHCVWDGGGYNDFNGTNFRMLAGYNGLSEDSYPQQNAAFNYFDASRLSGVGSNWLDYRFEEDGNDDQCPVVILYGETTTDTNAFHNDAGMDDRFSTGPIEILHRRRLTNCVPLDGA